MLNDFLNVPRVAKRCTSPRGTSGRRQDSVLELPNPRNTATEKRSSCVTFQVFSIPSFSEKQFGSRHYEQDDSHHYSNRGSDYPRDGMLKQGITKTGHHRSTKLR